MDIDRLQNREDANISLIRFQQVAPGQETMILCTAYGLLIYECTVNKIKPKDEGQEESKRSKRASSADRENDKPKIALTATYKLSVLPDERVIDCLSFNTTQNEAQLLVCCASGSYVILKKLTSIMYQEVWRFKGFSLPPKGLMLCDA